jgi:hypothetical protein
LGGTVFANGQPEQLPFEVGVPTACAVDAVSTPPQPATTTTTRTFDTQPIQPLYRNQRRRCE